jgi:hypothetical protein
MCHQGVVTVRKPVTGRGVVDSVYLSPFFSLSLSWIDPEVGGEKHTDPYRGVVTVDSSTVAVRSLAAQWIWGW